MPISFVLTYENVALEWLGKGTAMSTVEAARHTESPHPTEAEAAATARPGWKPRGSLPEGPLDLVGDVHGEIDALTAVLDQLGYGKSGAHPEGRRLVFVGDLIDRGPDSPAVVRRVADLIDRGAGSMVLGNHDLNALLGKQRPENTWILGHGPVAAEELAVGSDRERNEILDFLRTQPVVLERPDLRVVHACWDDGAIRVLEEGAVFPEPTAAHHHHRDRILAKVAGEPDNVLRKLASQNENPIRLITSGPETRAKEPFFSGGQMREEARLPWWQEYKRGPVVVFGHYWRVPVREMVKDDGLFGGQPYDAMLAPGRSICIDYSVGARAAERKVGRTDGAFHGRLAALRWPEQQLVFDDGERWSVRTPTGTIEGGPHG
jgi:hypothetical protein